MRRTGLSFLCLLAVSSSLPAPQSSDDSDGDLYGDDYADYNAETKDDGPAPAPDLGALLQTGTSLAQNLFSLLGQKVKFLNSVLADQVTRIIFKIVLM